MLNATDDPVIDAGVAPKDAIAANPHIILAETTSGGHLGWTSKTAVFQAACWSDYATLEFLQHHQRRLAAQGQVQEQEQEQWQPRSSL